MNMMNIHEFSGKKLHSML